MQTFSTKWKLIFDDILVVGMVTIGLKCFGNKILVLRKAGDPKLVILKREPFLPSKNAPKNGVCKNSTQRLTNIPSVT